MYYYRRYPLYISVANLTKRLLSYKILVQRAHILLDIYEVPLSI